MRWFFSFSFHIIPTCSMWKKIQWLRIPLTPTPCSRQCRLEILLCFEQTLMYFIGAPVSWEAICFYHPWGLPADFHFSGNLSKLPVTFQLCMNSFTALSQVQGLYPCFLQQCLWPSASDSLHLFNDQKLSNKKEINFLSKFDMHFSFTSKWGKSTLRLLGET